LAGLWQAEKYWAVAQRFIWSLYLERDPIALLDARRCNAKALLRSSEAGQDWAMQGMVQQRIQNNFGGPATTLGHVPFLLLRPS